MSYLGIAALYEQFSNVATSRHLSVGKISLPPADRLEKWRTSMEALYRGMYHDLGLAVRRRIKSVLPPALKICHVAYVLRNRPHQPRHFKNYSAQFFNAEMPILLRGSERRLGTPLVCGWPPAFKTRTITTAKRQIFVFYIPAFTSYNLYYVN
jgi:hypothetical protein